MVATGVEVSPATVPGATGGALDELAAIEALLVKQDADIAWLLTLRGDPHLRECAARSREILGRFRAALTVLTVEAMGSRIGAVQCRECLHNAPVGAFEAHPSGEGWRCRDRIGCRAEAALNARNNAPRSGQGGA